MSTENKAKSGLAALFDQAVLQLPGKLADKQSYETALNNMGWRLLEWDENPLNEPHPLNPVRVKLETESGKTKDFIFIRSGNSATFAIIRHQDNGPEVLVRHENKGSGIRVTTMPSGHMNTADNTIADAALRELQEESGFVVTDFIAVANSMAPVPNNMSNTSTSFFAEVSANDNTPQGWEFIPLADAPARINHGPSQITAMFACAYYNVSPNLTYVHVNAETPTAKPGL